MIIDYLGHSEVLINIKNSNNENVQILSDAWLSSYSVADLMQRNPIIKLDYENFAPDVIFEDFPELGIDAYRMLVRAGVTWSDVEPGNDQWNFEKSDYVIQNQM